MCSSDLAAVRIPVIAHGGPGKTQHVVDVVQQCHVSAVAVSSLLHYEAIRSIQTSASGTAEGNREFLHSGRSVSHVQPCTMQQLKHSLLQAGAICRMEPSP